MTTNKNNTTTATEKTNKQGEKNMMNNNTAEIKYFSENHLMLQLAEEIGVNLEKGINYSAMNDESNFIPYAYLVLTDEKDKLEISIAGIKKVLEDMPANKDCNKREKLEKDNKKQELEDCENRLNNIIPVLETLQELKPVITPISTLWAYSHGTKKFANGETVANQAKMLESVAKLHKMIKSHNEEIIGFAKEENRKGQVYKDMKKELTVLFSLLFGTSITANASDVAWIANACTSTKGGVKTDSNAADNKIAVVRKDTVLKKVCDCLSSKLKKREENSKGDGTTTEKQDGKDCEIPVSFMPEKQEKDSDVITVESK